MLARVHIYVCTHSNTHAALKDVYKYNNHGAYYKFNCVNILHGLYRVLLSYTHTSIIHLCNEFELGRCVFVRACASALVYMHVHYPHTSTHTYERSTASIQAIA